MTYQLLIVDNDDQTDGIDKIQNLVRSKPFAIECHQFNVGLPDGNEVIDDNGKIDLALVREKFQEQFGTRKFHMIIFDFKLNDPDDAIDGVKIIQTFNGFVSTRKSKKMLYSSELAQIVQSYLDDYKSENASFTDSWKKFQTLIKIDIIDFCRREDYEEKVVEYIPKTVVDNDDFIVSELRGNRDLEFNSAIATYEGKTFEEIADAIDGNDSQATKFKKELIASSIASLVKLDGL